MTTAKSSKVVPQFHRLTFAQRVIRDWKLNKWKYILILPVLVYLALFCYKPMYGLIIAFKNYKPTRGIERSTWMDPWYGWFERFFTDPYFGRLIGNTFIISLLTIVFGFPAPILLAFLLNRILSSKIKQKVQLVLYMPNFISVIVLCGIVRILLSPTGMVNAFLGTNINFMTMPKAFRTIYIASGIWQGAGWASIIYTAALSNASKDLKEAAVIDGANLIQQIKTVEWPAIKDTVLIQFIMAVGNIMSVGFEKAYALQTDLNMAASEIISTYVYKKGLLDGDYGFSTAVGLFNTVINIVLLVSMNTIVKKMNEGKGI